MPARTVAALLLLAAAATACAGSEPPAAVDASPAAPAGLSLEYSPGLSEDLFLPDAKGDVPLVVLVPGGSWTTSDPGGFAGLAADLARSGIVAATAHVRAAEDGVVYPVPLQDILCAVAVATRRVHELGFDPGPIAVLGHSSGAHLAALAVLAYDDYPSSCEAPPVEPDALIGLSGPYDISRIPDIAAPLFGTAISEDPDTWASANPVARAALRPDVPVLLLHGEDDTNVPVDFTTDFGDALEAAGHPTTVTVVPGVDHFGIFRPEVAGDPVAEWLLGLP